MFYFFMCLIRGMYRSLRFNLTTVQGIPGNQARIVLKAYGAATDDEEFVTENPPNRWRVVDYKREAVRLIFTSGEVENHWFLIGATSMSSGERLALSYANGLLAARLDGMR